MENEIEWREGMNFQATNMNGDIFQYSHEPIPWDGKGCWMIFMTPDEGSRVIYIGFGDCISQAESFNSLVERNEV